MNSALRIKLIRIQQINNFIFKFFGTVYKGMLFGLYTFFSISLLQDSSWVIGLSFISSVQFMSLLLRPISH